MLCYSGLVVCQFCLVLHGFTKFCDMFCDVLRNVLPFFSVLRRFFEVLLCSARFCAVLRNVLDNHNILSHIHGANSIIYFTWDYLSQ